MKIRMELTEALVTEDITPFERERLREALEEEVRRQLPTDRRLLRVVDWDPGGGHAVENAPGMRKYRVAYETEPRDYGDSPSCFGCRIVSLRS
jgi:hypothetical protein